MKTKCIAAVAIPFLALTVATVPATAAAKVVPFQTTITINFPAASKGGAGNGDVSPGTQTVAVPAGKRLVVQTVSVYRANAPAGSTLQIFMNTSVGNTYSAYGLPIVPSSTLPYSGTTMNAPFYADGGTQLLANGFRDSTGAIETDTVSISGYLIAP